MANDETTDITLFVKTSGEEIARWNRQRIVDALIRETDIDVDTAEVISREVEKQIIASGISVLTTPLIRELVDAKLIERGLEQARKMHALLGFPLAIISDLIVIKSIRIELVLPLSVEYPKIRKAENFRTGEKRRYKSVLIQIFLKRKIY